ncbi:MAG: ferrous iron transport protein B [Acutalibacteraceae bacterium]
MNLNELPVDKKGVIKKIGSKGTLRRRMIDMGITPGTLVKVVKYAPLGDPIQINIHGYDLSIRRSEAEAIQLFDSEREAEEYLKDFTNSKISSEDKKIVPFLNFPQNYFGKKDFTVALIGNPNSGKTTLFNNLTGSYQYVGNWPGVTVERKEGTVKNSKTRINIVDLPGIYSLSPYSPEEIVTREYLFKECPDLIVNIVDATNLERGLYLTTQLLELDCRMILALNMTDLLLSKGKIIDYKTLEKELGVVVVPISAGKNQGIDMLISKISSMSKDRSKFRRKLNIYPSEIEKALSKIDLIVNKDSEFKIHNRFNIVKIFENDPYIIKELKISDEELCKINKIRSYISVLYDKEQDIIIPDERYKYTCRLCSRAVKNVGSTQKLSFSDKVDKILTGKYTSIPCFLIFIMSIFYITFGPFGTFLKYLCEKFVNGNIHMIVQKNLEYFGASSWCKSLVLDAVIDGVGAVISFLPQVILLFFLLSILEDCGYMARAAFIMDKPFRKIGLSGKAFVPLIMGFGCSVPAVMGTKILENKKDKNLTIFLIPFMSCSAKLPVYLLFASAFFPNYQTIAVFSLYLIGILMAIFTAFLFKDNLFKGEDSPFIMEMPEYKLPTAKNVWLSVWDRTKDFIERAGTVILVATVVVWFLQSFDFSLNFVSDNSKSILASIGGVIAPIFSLCGFENWKASVALLTGVMAKESIVSTFSVLYGAENLGELSEILKGVFPVCSAVAFMVFALLYTPCIAAISAINKELKNFKLTATLIIYQLLIAYLFSALTFQILNLVLKCVKV